MAKKDFFEVPRTKRQFSLGEAEFPILYYDVSVLFAFYWVDIPKLSSKLEGTGLSPYKFINGKGMIGLAFFEYRETSIGSYNEVGTAIASYPENENPTPFAMQFLKPSQDRRVGFYILDLPVTTDIAYCAGKEVWGYPKFVTKITFQMDKTSFASTIYHPESDQEILTLSGSLGWGFPLPAIDLLLYSNLNGKLIRTITDTDATVSTRSGGGLRLTIGDSNHQMANNLRDLGLMGQSPYLIQFTDHIRTRLNLGKEIGSVSN